MPVKARAYLALVIFSGLFTLTGQFLQWHAADPLRFSVYLLLSLVASALKVDLPGIADPFSVNFLFVLLGIVDLSLPETLAIGAVGILVQSAWKLKGRFRPVYSLFSIANMAIAIFCCYQLFHWKYALALNQGSPGLLLITALLLFLLNTGPVAVAVTLTESKPLLRTWRTGYFWIFPVYLAGACVAWAVNLLSRVAGWHGFVILLPVIYFIYRSYRLYLSRLDAERKHVEEVAGLHLRTIEALALAIEAKDHRTHEHLRRVQTYAMEVGRELQLEPAEMQALGAAALLHDIGKLAVPEQILSKPGKLTPEEFEKIKVHPVVGAEILERVSFPYPVVPIVHAHHERWDGSGYPAGLKGQEIPLGARILAAVDCLDALASDREYRKALSLDEAMRQVTAASGQSFDPAVVEVLNRRYVELEEMAQARRNGTAKLSVNLKIAGGKSPGAGFERRRDSTASEVDFLASIAAARQEVQLLFELAHDLGNSLSLDETLSVLAMRLKHMIPYDSIAIYIRRKDRLVPEYVSGEEMRLFASLTIPVGSGLSGWVAQNKKPIFNGNPWVESAYLQDPNRWSTLGSALAVPLEGVDGVIGVLTLYRREAEAFTKDHLRIMLAVSSKISLAIENALTFRQVESSAATDYLTGLPNARSLFLRLNSELARSARSNEPIAVLVCDLNGFKQINDHYGHLEGNRALRLIAESFKRRCREYDYVARMGGDEFVLILPGGVKAAVLRRITELSEGVRAVGQTAFAIDTLSLSVGAAFYPEDGCDAEQLLAEADRRMYKAKQDGKAAAAAIQTDLELVEEAS